VSPERPGRASEASVARERVAIRLADQGYQEAITYSFVDPGLQRMLLPQASALALANPIASDLAEMRVSLWPGLVGALRENQRRQQDRVRLFEIGTRFDVSGSATGERLAVAAVCTGNAYPEQWDISDREVDFYDLKADVEALLSLASAGGLQFEPGGPECLHPGRSAWILRDGQRIGTLGELHPEYLRDLDLRGPVLLFELDFERSFASQPAVYREISRYPQVRRDLAVVIDEQVPLAALMESASVAARGLLREIRIFDVYRGPGIESGRKSIALGLILQETSRTLTDTDVDQAVARVAARLKQDHQATLRD
jgi:phenylalanyl-tRNA synthetase beta chain